MPRSGSTHVVRLLGNWEGVQRIGMHEAAPADVIDSGRAMIGTIRNPWDWYVSQWTIGCGGTGLLHRVTTRDRRTLQHGPRRGEIFDPRPWQRVYADRSARDVGAFRAWLELLFDADATGLAMPRAYGGSDLRNFAGWYTYRYIELYCADRAALHRRGAVSDVAQLRELARHQLYITHMARTEQLGSDLVQCLEQIGVPLGTARRKRILGAEPSNRSHRSLPTEAYFDDRSRGLVERGDVLIVDQIAALAAGKPDLRPWAPAQAQR